jgi:NDP-sugar pyrophosphorylase family protein
MSEKPTIILLAGGRGTRLGDLTNLTPKPMIDINGKPFIESLVLKYVDEGYRDFIISINYLGAQIKQHLNKLQLPAALTFVRDPKGVTNKDEAIQNLMPYVGYNGAWFINADTYIPDALPHTEGHSHIALVHKDTDAGAQYISTKPNTLVKIVSVSGYIDIGTPEGLERMRNDSRTHTIKN